MFARDFSLGILDAWTDSRDMSQSQSDIEREAIREVMSLLGSRKSKRKAEAARANAKKRWESVRKGRKGKENLTPDTNGSHKDN
jgi:hypothetical protein